MLPYQLLIQGALGNLVGKLSLGHLVREAPKQNGATKAGG